jgi:hypothetical protein
VVAAPQAAAERAALPKQFLWPTREVLQLACARRAALPFDEIEPKSLFTQWLRNIVPAAALNHQVTFYRDARFLGGPRYLPVAAPRSGYDMIRCIWVYGKKPIPVPDGLQIVTDKAYSLDGRSTAIVSVTDGQIKQGSVIAEIDSARKALEDSILADRFKRIPWGLRGYEADVELQTVAYRFAGSEEYLPFALTVTLGPRGTLLALEGRGLDALVDPPLAESLKRESGAPPKTFVTPATRDTPN